MASEFREWSVPAPVRTLLWWPAISFVLVIVAPDAATWLIVAAGACLALLGGLLAALARRLTRPAATDMSASEFPTVEIPPVQATPGRTPRSNVRGRAA